MKRLSCLFKGRINRRNFLIGNIISWFLIFSLIFSLFASVPHNQNDISNFAVLTFLILDVLFLTFLSSLIIRRYHDLGWSGWNLLLLFIPIMNLYLLLCLFLKIGQDKNNKYGDTPGLKVNFPDGERTNDNLINNTKWPTLIILLVIVGSTSFYWFQWRPTQIKHACSWVKMHTAAIPAKPAITEHGEYTSSGIQILPGSLLAKDYKTSYPSYTQPAKPAIPAKDWTQPAMEQQYEFCLHNNGL